MADTMISINVEAEHAEGAVAPALAETIARLCNEGRNVSADALERCERIIEDFGAVSPDRRQRASSMTALRLAIGNRMPSGFAKRHVDQILLDQIAELQREGRYDVNLRRRRGFSA